MAIEDGGILAPGTRSDRAASHSPQVLEPFSTLGSDGSVPTGYYKKPAKKPSHTKSMALKYDLGIAFESRNDGAGAGKYL